MVKIPPLIAEEDFLRISQSIRLLPDVDLDEFKREIFEARSEYGRNNLELNHGPSLKGLKAMLRKAEITAVQRADEIEDLFYFESDDCGYTFVPDWLKPLLKSLRNTENESAKLLENFPEVKPGKDPDLAFIYLVHTLGKIFERYTGEKATAYTNSDKDDPDEQKTTDFQNFARACCIGFGDIKIITTFDKKVQSTLKTLRNPSATT